MKPISIYLFHILYIQSTIKHA